MPVFYNNWKILVKICRKQKSKFMEIGIPLRILQNFVDKRAQLCYNTDILHSLRQKANLRAGQADLHGGESNEKNYYFHFTAVDHFSCADGYDCGSGGKVSREF